LEVTNPLPKEGVKAMVPHDAHSGTAGRFRLLIAHTLGKLSPAVPVLFEPRESDRELVRLAGCQDCSAMPVQTSTTPPGFGAAVVLQHDATCPAMAEALAGGR
jgi:hypothetical protein